MTYRIVRRYKDQGIRNHITRRGLTLEQAQAHCQDPETSSSTCTTDEGKARTIRCGPWFDGYEEDR